MNTARLLTFEFSSGKFRPVEFIETLAFLRVVATDAA
jgi:hypothetical protein